MNKDFKTEERTEQILTEALVRHEHGESFSHILNSYPEFKSEITEMFVMIEKIHHERHALLVPKENLKKILAHMPMSTLETLNSKNFLTALEAYFKKSGWRIAAPLVIALLVVGVVFDRSRVSNHLAQTQNNIFPEQNSSGQTSPQNFASTLSKTSDVALPPPPPATGSVDDAVAAFIQESNQEAAVAAASDNAASAVTSPSQAPNIVQ